MGKRTSSIRWRENDQKELERLVRNYNAKIYRLGKKYEEDKSVMPATIKKKDIAEMKKGISTRSDFNKLKKELSTIDNATIHTTRGGKMSVGDYKKWRTKAEKVEKIKAMERERLEKLPTFTAGKKTGLTKAQMHTVKENTLKPRSYTVKNMSSKEIEKSFKNLDSYFNKKLMKERKKAYRDNYIKSLVNNGLYTEELEQKIKKVPLDWFVDTAELDEQAGIDYAYTEGERDTIYIQISNAWDESYKRYKEAKKTKETVETVVKIIDALT